MIFYTHKGYQPVIRDGIPSLPYSEDPNSEYYLYWAEQFDRCLNGYKPDGYAKISGRYYFYLNFCKIKMADEGGREVISHPFYRDLDHELSEVFERAKREHKGIILPKSREKGITYDCLGMTILYEVVMFEASEVAVGTGIPKDMEKDRIVIADMYSRLPQEFKGGFIKQNLEMWKFGRIVQEILPDGRKRPPTEEGIRSIIHWRPNFNRNVDGFNSLRLAWAFMDECGLINRLMDIHIKNKATFMRGTIQFGSPIYGGTAKSFDSKDNDYERMYDMADALNLIRFEVYARKALHGFIDYNTGISDEEGAQKWIDEHIYKPVAHDKIALSKVQQEYPSEPEHFWMRKSGGLLPLSIINDQIKNIKLHKGFDAREGQHGEIEKGFLKWKGGFGKDVEWTPSPRGNIYIYKHPKKDSYGRHLYENLYVGGVDPYNKVSTVESDSMGACYIYERFLGIAEECEMPVLEYVDRPQHTEFDAGEKFVEKDIFYNNLYKIAVYYGCKLLVEDTDQQLFSKFKEWGASHKVLAPIPTNVVSMNTKQQNKYGISPSTGVITKMTDYLDTYLKQHPDSVLYLRLLEDLKKWGAANTDMAIAFGYCLLYNADLDAKKWVAKSNRKINDKPIDFGAQWIRNERNQLVCISGKDYISQIQNQLRWQQTGEA